MIKEIPIKPDYGRPVKGFEQIGCEHENLITAGTIFHLQ